MSNPEESVSRKWNTEDPEKPLNPPSSHIQKRGTSQKGDERTTGRKAKTDVTRRAIGSQVNLNSECDAILS